MLAKIVEARIPSCFWSTSNQIFMNDSGSRKGGDKITAGDRHCTRTKGDRLETG